VTLPVPAARGAPLSTVAQLALIPEEEIWLDLEFALRASFAREESVADRYNRATIFATLPKKRSATGPEHLCLS
jgi:hypothetical protein